MFSTFWHQLFRAAFIANASLIARILVAIPKGGPVYRGVITFLIFCLAAAVHAVGLWTGRPTCDVIPMLRFYLLMGMATCSEDLMESIYWWVKGGRQGDD